MGETQIPPPTAVDGSQVSGLSSQVSPELYPGHAAELAKKATRDGLIAQANAEPFPGPLAQAFAQGPVRVGEFTIREFVPMDAAILRRLNSPFYQQILEVLKPAAQRKPTPYEDADEWQVIFLFTRPCAEAERILNAGPAVFAQAAREAFAHNPRINLALYEDLFTACAGRIMAAFHTALNYRAAASEGDGTVFTMPPAGPTTASAGGSIILAD